MIYRGYNFEVPLRASQFKIYHVDTLSMPIEGVPEEEPLEEPRHSVAGVMTKAQRRAAQERLQKQAQDAQTAGTGPTWFHTVTGTSWQTQGTDPTWQPHGGSVNAPWGHEPSAAFSQQQGGGTYYGYGSTPYEAGPSASARFGGDPLSAIFGSLAIQD
ncbi:hypothetical protein U9M48_027607 [Paspalum notatum var. saurae]|uniref:Uncharacterized protein n=1 Tax=Paspalum notatum var. saurae TaxID=547442 RepID=A0AAQ3TVI4_PASNO